MTNPPPGSKRIIGDFSPKLVQLTDEVLFADVWERPGLSLRDRSMITVAALVMGGNTEQLGGHISRAIGNGVTADELSELITHLAFYAGWPKALSAVTVARRVLEES